MTIQFTIPGIPQGKARARVTKRGTFTPTKTKQYQDRVKIMFRLKNPGRSPHTGPVRLEIVAYYRRPKSHYGTGRNAGRVKGSAPVWPLVKPDCDNVEKAVADALNGIAYNDDSQIVDSHFLKLYQIQGAKPCVIVRLEFWEQETIQEHCGKGRMQCE